MEIFALRHTYNPVYQREWTNAYKHTHWQQRVDKRNKQTVGWTNDQQIHWSSLSFRSTLVDQTCPPNHRVVPNQPNEWARERANGCTRMYTRAHLRENSLLYDCASLCVRRVPTGQVFRLVHADWFTEWTRKRTNQNSKNTSCCLSEPGLSSNYSINFAAGIVPVRESQRKWNQIASLHTSWRKKQSHLDDFQVCTDCKHLLYCESRCHC